LIGKVRHFASSFSAKGRNFVVAVTDLRMANVTLNGNKVDP
jgi:hypothetical protein